MFRSLFKPNFPFKPKRFPFFYGWIVTIVATLGMASSIPGQTMGIGVFTEYLIEKTGLTRLEISTAYMVGTIISALLIPFAGRFLDKIGARTMIIISGFGLGLGLLFLAGFGEWNQAVLDFFPWFSVTLKATLNLCITRDKNREKTLGVGAASVVYTKSTEFDYGNLVDVSQPIEKCVREIIEQLPK